MHKINQLKAFFQSSKLLLLHVILQLLRHLQQQPVLHPHKVGNSFSTVIISFVRTDVTPLQRICSNCYD